MSRFQLETSVEQGVTRVRVKGELDLDSSPELLDALKARFGDGPGVEVDLAGVDYIDSSGVAVLIHGYKLARKRGIDFALRDPSDRVRAVLELSQLREFFDVRQSGGS